METLLTYVYEALSKRFEEHTNDVDSLFNIRHLNVCRFPELKDFFAKAIKSCPNPSDAVFIYASGAKYFKMPYEFTPILKAQVNVADMDVKQIGGEKIALYYKKKKIVETGRGSADKISTSLQENSTCTLFNICMSVGKDEEVDLDKLKDLDYIRNILIDAYGVDAEILNKSWLGSFSVQIATLINFCKSIGVDARDYRMTRYGNSDDVATCYTNMVKSYTKHVGGEGRNSKDTFDPSDVILYNLGNVKSIQEICKGGSDSESCISIRDQYLNELFSKHICMGISLKKITSKKGRVDLFNIGATNVVKLIESVEEVSSTDQSKTLLCTGKFDFSSITDNDGDKVGNTINSVLLTMRTFGSGNVGIDVKLNEKGSPALGKCPIKIWMNELGCKNSKNINDCISKFEALKDKKSISIVTTLIHAAIKEGPHCFPFILLH